MFVPVAFHRNSNAGRIDRETEERETETDGQIDNEWIECMDKKAEGKLDRQEEIDRQTDRQTDRQIDR